MLPQTRLAPLAAALCAFGLCAAPASASDRDRAFFEQVSGIWKGPGEIVAGKYKGTKFVCNLTGDPGRSKKAALALDGSCRVGVFNQKMSARIEKSGGVYKGMFLDGAKGEGLDVVSGTVQDNRVVLAINRNKLNGAMVARLDNRETMNITISVKVGEAMVPVIGMTLKRDVDPTATGAIRN